MAAAAPDAGAAPWSSRLTTPRVSPVASGCPPVTEVTQSAVAQVALSVPPSSQAPLLAPKQRPAAPSSWPASKPTQFAVNPVPSAATAATVLSWATVVDETVSPRELWPAGVAQPSTLSLAAADGSPPLLSALPSPLPALPLPLAEATLELQNIETEESETAVPPVAAAPFDDSHDSSAFEHPPPADTPNAPPPRCPEPPLPVSPRQDLCSESDATSGAFSAPSGQCACSAPATGMTSSALSDQHQPPSQPLSQPCLPLDGLVASTLQSFAAAWRGCQIHSSAASSPPSGASAPRRSSPPVAHHVSPSDRSVCYAASCRESGCEAVCSASLQAQPETVAAAPMESSDRASTRQVPHFEAVNISPRNPMSSAGHESRAALEASERTRSDVCKPEARQIDAKKAADTKKARKGANAMRVAEASLKKVELMKAHEAAEAVREARKAAAAKGREEAKARRAVQAALKRADSAMLAKKRPVVANKIDDGDDGDASAAKPLSDASTAVPAAAACAAMPLGAVPAVQSPLPPSTDEKPASPGLLSWLGRGSSSSPVANVPPPAAASPSQQTAEAARAKVPATPVATCAVAGPAGPAATSCPIHARSLESHRQQHESQATSAMATTPIAKLAHRGAQAATTCTCTCNATAGSTAPAPWHATGRKPSVSKPPAAAPPGAAPPALTESFGGCSPRATAWEKSSRLAQLLPQEDSKMPAVLQPPAGGSRLAAAKSAIRHAEFTDGTASLAVVPTPMEGLPFVGTLATAMALPAATPARFEARHKVDTHWKVYPSAHPKAEAAARPVLATTTSRAPKRTPSRLPSRAPSQHSSRAPSHSPSEQGDLPPACEHSPVHSPPDRVYSGSWPGHTELRCATPDSAPQVHKPWR